MGTVIQDTQQRNSDRQPRWDRFERADLFEHYRELRAQGLSQRQAAQELQVPRTTLQAWRTWHDTLDICPDVARFFQSSPGLAFVHRLVIAFHLGCVEVGACGMRLACLSLKLSGLDRFVAASYGAQPQVNRQVDAAMLASRQSETARLAQDMPRKDLTVTQDETFTGGLCLVTMDPDSNFIILEQLAQARDKTSWNALMAPALAPRNCQVIQSTSDEAPGLLAYVEHSLSAHHSPDLFHVQHELSKAVSAPMAIKERAAHKAAAEAQEQLREQMQTPLQTTGGEPEKRGPGRPAKAPVSLEQAEQALEAASREHERVAQQREQVSKSIRAIGHAYHVVDLERGIRRNGQLIAADIQGHIEQARAIAQHEGLSPSCLERIEKAERVVPKMQATIEFVSRYVRQQGEQLDLTQPASFALHAKLIPSFYLDRVAQTRNVRLGEPLRELAEQLRAPLFEPGGALSALSPEAQDQLHDEAKRLAAVFQRSSSNVEGRNGSLSLRNHQLRGLGLPRKRECFTAMHNFFLTRPDGTTAAERFFGQKPRSMFAAILASVELPPAPLSPHLDEHKVADPMIEPKLMAPPFVKPYVKSNKNDSRDAEAIAEAVTRPTMRFVPTKEVDQQDIQALHRVRERLIGARTALVNEVHGLMHEYGIVIPKGVSKFRQAVVGKLESEKDKRTPLSQEMFWQLVEEFVALEKRLAYYQEKLEALATTHPECQRLMTIPGIGPLSATALVAAVSDASAFQNGRQCAAWLGLVPRQQTTGGKERLLGISKRGDTYLRKLLVHGARATIRWVGRKTDRRSQWMRHLLERRGKNRTAVAVANKNARIVWALLTSHQDYQPATS